MPFSSMTIRSRPRRSLDLRVPREYETRGMDTSISLMGTCIGVKSFLIRGSWNLRWTFVRGRVLDLFIQIYLALQMSGVTATRLHSMITTTKSLSNTMARRSRKRPSRVFLQPLRIGKRSRSITSEGE